MDNSSTIPPHLPSRRNLRWTTGVILMSYVAAHLANHALGLVSLAAAESALQVMRAFWHGVPGSFLLYGAATAHVSLAAIGLWQRRSLRMPPMEGLRLLLGFSLPLLLAAHLTAMRWAYEVFALEPSYARVVWGHWNLGGAIFILVMMLAAWTHGCLGLHFALRARATYRRYFRVLFAMAALLALLAALGFFAMGRQMQWTGTLPDHTPTASQRAAIEDAESDAKWWYLLALLGLLASRQIRARIERFPSKRLIELRYPGRTVHIPHGWSVLEASRAHGIAHVSVCGGRARCSTCRVRVVGPASHMDPPDHDERRTLKRVGALEGVRLACQLRPHGDLAVTPMFAPHARAHRARLGQEREVAILFVDLRRWSGLADQQMPIDLVYVLEQYFAIVGAAVRETGGLPNQFIGDSVMSIFGLDTDLPTACRQAVHAAQLIGERMDAWGDDFESQFGQRLDFGMGLHAGRTAVGEVGYLDTTTFTAVGEVVNTASRLQDHSKVAAARLVISLFAAQQAGVADMFGAAEEVMIRGRSEGLEVLYVLPPTR